MDSTGDEGAQTDDLVDDNEEKSAILTVHAAEISDTEGSGTPEEQVVNEKQEDLGDEEQKESTEEQKESQKEEAQATDDSITNKEDTETTTSGTDGGTQELVTESGDVTEEKVEEEFVIPVDIDFTGDADQFIEFMAQGSQAAREHNIFPSVMIAQAILESGMGMSDLTQTNHNLFGIKGTYNGEGSSWATLEDSGAGNMYQINATFRAYPNYYTSILDYLELLQKEWYTKAGVTTATNPHAQIQAIINGGYATDSIYVDKIVDIITKYNLTQYD